MTSYVRRRLLLALMAGAGLVMACIVYAEIRARPVIRSGALSEGAVANRVPPLPLSRSTMPAKENFAVIVERPLFSPSRRPPAVSAAAAPIPAPDFSLFGVVISAGEPFALVKPSTGGDPVRITEGESMSGWTVARIEADRILVRHDAAERELLLDFSAPAPPPPETAVPNDAPADGQAAPAKQNKDKVPDSEQPEPAGQGQGN